MNSRTTPQFWQQFNALPSEIQQLARKNFDLWRTNQQHPSLHFKPFKYGQWSVRIGRRYRALGFFLDAGNFRWTWIGSHEDYNKL